MDLPSPSLKSDIDLVNFTTSPQTVEGCGCLREVRPIQSTLVRRLRVLGLNCTGRPRDSVNSTGQTYRWRTWSTWSRTFTYIERHEETWGFYQIIQGLLKRRLLRDVVRWLPTCPVLIHYYTCRWRCRSSNSRHIYTDTRSWEPSIGLLSQTTERLRDTLRRFGTKRNFY